MIYNNIFWSACYPNLEKGSEVYFIVRPKGTTGLIYEDVKKLCFEIHGVIGGEYNSKVLGPLGEFSHSRMETLRNSRIKDGWSALPIKTMKHFVPELEEEISRQLLILNLKYGRD